MKPHPLVPLGFLASMICGIAAGVAGYRAWLEPGPEDDHAALFERVLHEVQDSYVDEVPQEQLFRDALRGMLNRLDDHSAYLDTEDWDDLQSDTTGEFGGVGLELGYVDDEFTVISPMPATPAADAGLLPGDRILELDHESLAGDDILGVVKRMRGEPGSIVHLRVSRTGTAEPWDLDLVRGLISVASVTHRVLEPGYGYIRISQFQVQTGDEFATAVQDLENETGGPLLGLVLDLRNNPGGVLQASVEVADAMLRDGLIVYTEGRQVSSQLEFRAAYDDLLNGAPVAVLINEGSASAAEVVAGALQDHGRAVLIGTRSYGKGSVQSVLPVGDLDAIKLTTAYYFTPNGRNIHHAGIQPDIERASAAAMAAPSGEQHLLAEALSMVKGNGAGMHARL